MSDWRWGRIAFLFLALAVLAGGGIKLASSYYATHHRTVVVCGKEAVAKDGGGHEYRVYTDKGTFVMTDSFVAQRFSTADAYGRLQPNRTYDISYYGWRFGLTSSFPNITHYKLSIRQLPPGTSCSSSA